MQMKYRDCIALAVYSTLKTSMETASESDFEEHSLGQSHDIFFNDNW